MGQQYKCTCAYGHSDTFAAFNATDMMMAHVNHGESTTKDSISVLPYSQLDSDGSLPERQVHRLLI